MLTVRYFAGGARRRRRRSPARASAAGSLDDLLAGADRAARRAAGAWCSRRPASWSTGWPAMIAKRRCRPARPSTSCRPSPAAEVDGTPRTPDRDVDRSLGGPVRVRRVRPASSSVGIHLYLWKRLVRDTMRPGRGREPAGVAVVVLALLVPATLIGTRTGDVEWLAWPGYLWLALMFYLLVTLVVAGGAPAGRVPADAGADRRGRATVARATAADQRSHHARRPEPIHGRPTDGCRPTADRRRSRSRRRPAGARPRDGSGAATSTGGCCSPAGRRSSPG